MRLLAQSTDLPAVPSDTLKWVIVVMVAMLLIAIAVYSAFGLKRVKMDDQPPPIFRQAPRGYNPELCAARHGEIARRLGDHDKELDKIWQTLRHDLPEMERRMNQVAEERITKVHERVNDVLEAVSELKGQVIKREPRHRMPE
jgi:hypothetical protein